jgi:hypothetical protein
VAISYLPYSKELLMAKIIKLTKGKVLVSDLEHGMATTAGGIILTDDNMKESGVRNRWAQVYKVADDVTDIVPGEFVYLMHGKWTNKIKIQNDAGEDLNVWHIDYPEAVLLVSDERPDNRLDLAAAPRRQTHLVGY